MIAQGSGARAGEAGMAASDVTGQSSAEPLGRGIRWTLAPIRWGGELAAETRVLGGSEQPRRLQQVEIANIRFGSYIWEPWFAQISGSLGLVTGRERGGGGGESPVGAFAGGGNTTTVTGNGTLSVFPTSRFPFHAMFDVSDSRASGELTRSDFKSTRIGVRQAYRPLEGQSNFVLSYDRSVLDSPSFGRDTLDVLEASMNRNFGVQTLDVSGNHTRNTRSATGEGSNLNRLTARHTVRPGTTLSVDSFANLSSIDFHLQNNNLVTDNRSRFLQFNSFATWRPREGSPLYVTGGGRLFQATADTGGVASEVRSLNANVAAVYAWNRNTNVFGSASVTQVSIDGASDLIADQAFGVTYVADPRALGSFVYNWNASGNLSNQSGGEEGSRRNVVGQVGHQLTRTVPLSATSALSFDLGQNYSANADSVTAASHTLTHNAGVSWRLAPSQNATAYLSLLGADSRTTGQNENEFQLVNLQATGQVQFGRYSFGSANVTVQGTRQNSPTTPRAGFAVSSSGNLSYQHMRLFDVPRLRYQALYSVNDTQFQSRLLGDLDAPREQVSKSFEQRLEYGIGRIETRLSLRVAEIDGQRIWVLFFRIARPFGDF